MVAGSMLIASDAKLCVPVADVSGAALRLFTTPPDHPAVRSRTVELGDWVVVLDVLAASHRVTVLEGHSQPPLVPEAGVVSETVACLAGDGAACAPAPVSAKELPDRYQWSVGVWAMDFTARTIRGSQAVDDAADELEQLAGATTSLVAKFPGHRHAWTGLTVDLHRVDDGPTLTWHAWHLYPGEDPHVVISRTTATQCRMGKDWRC